MANRFAQHGCKVLLGGLAGKTLLKTLHEAVQIPPTLLVDNDEVHLILEYPKGPIGWGNLSSPRANRFIIVHDESNAVLKSMERFHEELTKFSPNLIIISGLHLLADQEAKFRSQRLNQLASYLTGNLHKKQSKNKVVPIHFELASIANEQYIKELANIVFPIVDSIGMNEVELVAVAKVLLPESAYDLEKLRNQDMKSITDVLLQFFEYFYKLDHQSVFTRIHFHSLAFHIVVKNINNGDTWGDSASAVSAGVMTCSRQACKNSTNMNDYDILVSRVWPILRHNNITQVPVETWVQDLPKYHQQYEFSVAPVLVCKKPGDTVGMGDSISAVGLLAHIKI